MSAPSFDCSAYLVDGNDFTAGLLDFTGLLQKVPEARLCDLCVGGKDAHSVELGNAVIVGWELASDDLVLVKTRHVCRVVGGWADQVVIK